MEEKALLQAIEKMMETVKFDMSQMMDDKLDAKLKPIHADISEIKERVTKIKITQENIIIPDIKKLREGHEVLNQKISALSDEFEAVRGMENDVFALKLGYEELKKAKKRTD